MLGIDRLNTQEAADELDAIKREISNHNSSQFYILVFVFLVLSPIDIYCLSFLSRYPQQHQGLNLQTSPGRQL